jgi:hypothetical protein
MERFIQNTNTQALKLLTSPDKINWFNLSLNNNSLALDLLEKIYPEINWDYLCQKYK